MNSAVKQRGFTLIEMLISATLLMIVMGTAMYGYQLYIQYWHKEEAQQSIQFDSYRNSDLFYTALRGIVPYAVQRNQVYAFYFLGRDDGFTAVTQSPIFNPGALAVIRVFRESLGQGGFQLVYEEASLRNILLMDAEQELPFSHRLVITKKLPQLSFQYQQTSHEVNDAFPDQLVRVRKWLPEFDGLLLGTHPTKIQLTINSLMIDIEVSDRQNLLLQRYQNGDFQT